MAGNLEKRVEQQVLRALLEKEAELDAALEQCHAQQQRPTLDSNDDEELERLREQRRRQLKTQQELQQQGMGTVEEIHDQKEFFELAKKFKNLVLVFFRPSFSLLEELWALLNKFAKKHLSVKVVCINAEKAQFLAERLKIWCLPTMVLVKDGKTEHSIVGLDEVGGKNLDLTALEETMARWKMIELET